MGNSSSTVKHRHWQILHRWYWELELSAGILATVPSENCILSCTLYQNGVCTAPCLPSISFPKQINNSNNNKNCGIISFGKNLWNHFKWKKKKKTKNFCRTDKACVACLLPSLRNVALQGKKLPWYHVTGTFSCLHWVGWYERITSVKPC